MEQYHTCEECERSCYTGGVAYPDGYICVDCEEEEEVQMEIERMEQKSKEFSEANLSVVKLRLEQKITKQEGNDMLKEKFPDMVSDDEEYCDNCDTELTEDTHIFIFTKGEDEKIMCDTCGQELAEKMRKDGWIRDDEDVDSRDAPNIYPYKKCSECGERKSCGHYVDDEWYCDECHLTDSDYYKCSECGCEMDEEDYWEGECEAEGECDGGECRVCDGRGICDGCWNAKH